jgi:hypothetical protein
VRRLAACLSARAADLCRWIAAWLFVARARVPAQGLVEYSLLLLLIVVVCIAIVTMLGQTVSEAWYQKILDTFPS